LALLLLGGAAAALAADAPATAPYRLVPMRDVRFEGGEDVAAAVAGGTARVELPFPLLWNGRRYTTLEIGPGWARALPRGAAPAGHGLQAAPLPASTPGTESPRPMPGPLFEVLAGDLRLGDGARVLVRSTPFDAAVRWWGLRADGVPGDLAAELILDRAGAVRYQYLQVHPLQAAPSGAAAPVRSALVGTGDDGATSLWSSGSPGGGLEPRNGLAVELTPPDVPIRLVPKAEGPPPAGCVSPAGSWCDDADGPLADTVIHLDERFETGATGWTTSGGNWAVIEYNTCRPGASYREAVDGTIGRSAYVGDTGTCEYDPDLDDVLYSPSVGPITADSYFTLLSRVAFEHPADTAELCVYDGSTLTCPWTIDPTGLNPDYWYRFTPISLDDPAWVGNTVQLAFRFTSDISVEDLGWMVDDVFVYEDNGADTTCVREALYYDGSPSLADCSDTLLDDWAFDETEFCHGCAYTFYALVECGTELHVPLSDMEGAEVTITEMVGGTSPALTCENDVSRLAPAPLTVYSTTGFPGDDCCNTGWLGPSFLATDNLGPGSVAWGFPDCPDPLGAYDLNSNGTVCDDAGVPPCGQVMDLLSPGEGQGIDCRVEGDPELCGIYRIDVVSGGFRWNLFANCTGNISPHFQIYTDCEDAWAAFTPLPEIAIADPQIVESCPGTEITFTLRNLGCVDWAEDVTVGVQSSCSPPDQATFVYGGGLAVGASRTETETFTLSCQDTFVTVTVDPADAILECTESPTAAACDMIPGADSYQERVCFCRAPFFEVDAGSADPLCEATEVSLTATVDATGCNDPVMYRWLNPDMTVASDWSESPGATVPIPCPVEDWFWAEATCNAGLCLSQDTVRVQCALDPESPDASADSVCPGSPTGLDCGTPLPGATYEWDFTDDGTFDAVGCAVQNYYSAAGLYDARVRVTSDGCSAERVVPVEVYEDVEPEALRISLEKVPPSGIRFSWAPAAEAVTYRVARGRVGFWYSHATDDFSGMGTCDTAGETFFEDPNDQSLPELAYYLGVGVNVCGSEGSWGADSDGDPRSDRIPSPSCP
jgi:hypothetical protein